MSATHNPSATVLRKTTLNATHRRLGAKMVDFSGWDMPLEYPATGGVIAEHMAVRTGVGIFDVSHMGEIRVHGPQALAGIQHLTMNDVSRIANGQCQYSAMLYPAGTFVDDLVVHKLGNDDFLMVINAGTREKDWAWVTENLRAFDCTREHLSDNFTQIAIQGPKAAYTLQKLTDSDLSPLKFYWFTHGTICGLKDILIARTGYTAEDGFEIYLPADETENERVWNKLLDAGREFGCLPCGLGARNTLRLEGKLPLYGHEISETITVWEAGLDRFCSMEKGDFVGKDELERHKAEGTVRRLVGLEVEGGIARDGYKVLDVQGREIGYVTSGSFSPFFKKAIALAYVPPEYAAMQSVVGIEVRGRSLKATVVPAPFYKRSRK